MRSTWTCLLALGAVLGCGGGGTPANPNATPTPAPTPSGGGSLPTDRAYEMGATTLQDLWVDPVSGDDSRTGRTRDQALRTVAAAWGKIPQGTTLTGTGYRIQLAPGTYRDGVPNYWESRHGTQPFPILFQAADGAGSVTLPDMNVFDCRYLYFVGVNFVKTVDGGDTFHLEKCDHVLLRNCVVSSGGVRLAQEAFKANQSQNLFVEGCDISGANDNAVDCVGVQYGHFLNNKIHNAEDWAMYLKGGSAYFRVDGNEFYDAGTGGFTAGQGTGFEFMSAPWLHYEAYDIKATNNLIHDCEGAALGVNGGYNILLAGNTAWRIGRRSHLVEVVFGERQCDGDTAACQSRIDAGGWGTTGRDGQPIGNRNVFIYNNVFYNPPGAPVAGQLLAVYAPRPASGSMPSPAIADANLQIKGNILWNSPSDTPVGVEEDQGCSASNPTCNLAQLRRDNALNTVNPQLGAGGRPGADLSAAPSVAIPDFDWGNLPARPSIPQGTLSNAVNKRRDGSARTSAGNPGAF